jgi:hypothetical protein
MHKEEEHCQEKRAPSKLTERAASSQGRDGTKDPVVHEGL